ncbi:hypothetical protein FTUN_2472 [Frigoriglobus tundricola]|uniref:Uncharacterized protein n=1 Tax=Frigoriglobus tundricola TaxID=2774151 RepID=A0A6M5YNP4_9BACT|nr:hypothetical protein FTUN_2472 [Frigoriglobus tundricola]
MKHVRDGDRAPRELAWALRPERSTFAPTVIVARRFTRSRTGSTAPVPSGRR